MIARCFRAAVALLPYKDRKPGVVAFGLPRGVLADNWAAEAVWRWLQRQDRCWHPLSRLLPRRHSA